MADDSLEINDELEFHPCDTPRGLQYYDLKGLTDEQQIHLNELKLKMIREDEIYLASHPEIRAIITLILHHVFKYQPRKELDLFIANYFLKEKTAIETEIESYLKGRQSHIYRGDSALVIECESTGESLLELERLQAEMERAKLREEAETITSEVLGEIVENILEKIDQEHRENVSYIRQLITEEVADKVGDRFAEDFKAFIIDELVKRISSDYFRYNYDDMTFEENTSDDDDDDFQNDQPQMPTLASQESQAGKH